METSPLIVIYVILAVAAFFLVRYLTLWYYRINEQVENQEKIIKLLEKIAGVEHTEEEEENQK